MPDKKKPNVNTTHTYESKHDDDEANVEQVPPPSQLSAGALQTSLETLPSSFTTPAETQQNVDRDPRQSMYDPDNEENKKRLKIEAVIKKFDETKSLTPQEVGDLRIQIKPWILRPIDFDQKDKKKQANILNQLNAQRERILGEYGQQLRSTPSIIPLETQESSKPSSETRQPTKIQSKLPIAIKKPGNVKPQIEPNLAASRIVDINQIGRNNKPSTSPKKRALVPEPKSSPSQIGSPPSKKLSTLAKVSQKSSSRPQTMPAKVTCGSQAYILREYIYPDESSETTEGNDLREAFIDIIGQRTCKENATSSSCNRAGVYKHFILSSNEHDDSTAGYWRWRVERLETHQLIGKEETPSYFAKSLIPTSQENCFQFYNRPDSIISEEEEAGVKSINLLHKKKVISFGLSACYATIQQLQDSTGCKKLWHNVFAQKLIQNMTLSMKVGHNMHPYPSPPQSWIDDVHTKTIQNTTAANTIFYDEADCPENFPAISSFILLKNMDRLERVADVLGTAIHGFDYEGFLPFEGYKLTYEATEAVIKLLCEQSNKDAKQKKKMIYFKPDLKIHTELKAAKTTKDYNNIIRLERELIRLKTNLPNICRGNYLIILLRFMPFLILKPSEILIRVDYEEGKFLAYTPTQSTTKIAEWHPHHGMSQLVGAPRSLSDQIQKLKDYLNDILPRKTIGLEEWISPTYFTNFVSLDKMNDEDTTNNRLLLCRFVDYIAHPSKEPKTFVHWKVGKPRPTIFKIQGASNETEDHITDTVPRLNNYIQNYKHHSIGIPVPYDLMKELYGIGAFYDWAMPYLKMRYLDLVRDFIENLHN